MPNTSDRLTLVAGGAGFIGSHLCRMLLESGERVVCLDNLQTSRRSNLLALQRYENFEFVRHDITAPLPTSVVSRTRQFHCIYNLACAASPPQVPTRWRRRAASAVPRAGGASPPASATPWPGGAARRISRMR